MGKSNRNNKDVESVLVTIGGEEVIPLRWISQYMIEVRARRGGAVTQLAVAFIRGGSNVVSLAIGSYYDSQVFKDVQGYRRAGQQTPLLSAGSNRTAEDDEEDARQADLFATAREMSAGFAAGVDDTFGSHADNETPDDFPASGNRCASGNTAYQYCGGGYNSGVYKRSPPPEHLFDMVKML